MAAFQSYSNNRGQLVQSWLKISAKFEFKFWRFNKKIKIYPFFLQFDDRML